MRSQNVTLKKLSDSLQKELSEIKAQMETMETKFEGLESEMP